jgi:hypothetical protein
MVLGAGSSDPRAGDRSQSGGSRYAVVEECELDVDAGPLAESCHMLENVCVDQVIHV